MGPCWSDANGNLTNKSTATLIGFVNAYTYDDENRLGDPDWNLPSDKSQNPACPPSCQQEDRAKGGVAASRKLQ